MEWEDNGKHKVINLLRNRSVEVGRNDEDGYYFSAELTVSPVTILPYAITYPVIVRKK